ncbi:murein transglycosylase [Vibrio sp. WXL103]|uniref:murein transglycosylase n=1 Tax=Vibrio sp. WXL103 TaxID=3450710 RepID=UPI003EC90376
MLKIATACCAAVAVLALGSSWLSKAKGATLEEQRKMYDDAKALVEMRQIERFSALRSQITQYPLTPYLDYRVFLIDLAERSPAEVEQFIADHNTLPFSRSIRAIYLDGLAAKRRWSDWLVFQPNLPNDERYRCQYYVAKLETGDTDAAYAGAKTLWQSGRSVSDACDPLFRAWSKAGHKTDQDILERMLLAFEQRNSSLMSYLSRQAKSEQAQSTAEQVLALNRKPNTVVTFTSQQSVNAYNQKLVELALKKLARSDTEQSIKAQEQIKPNFLTPEQLQSVADYTARRLMTTDSQRLISWRDAVIERTRDQSLIERRVRLAIGQADWAGVEMWLSLLSSDALQSQRWSYWQARADLALDNTERGELQLQSLVGERNFYSVAAATALEQDYQYPTSSQPFEQSQVAAYQSSLARIEELIRRDKITTAKSEWRFLLSRVEQGDKQLLASFAASKRWYNLTVTATIEAQMWDNIELRFPIAHRWWFEFYAKRHDLNLTTLLSLARQESALDVEARSPVGARGIMQIMPATAKDTARKFGLSYSGSQQLYQVEKNIEIGSQYLKSLMNRYDDNRIFALAAYNAGPGRVRQWRERSDAQLDVFAFIEAIPFYETRNYVQNILMFETYYRDNLELPAQFLTEQELVQRY